MDEITQSQLTFELDAPLRYDDEADRPIGYALTGRGRREAAPERAPALRLVRPGGESPVRHPGPSGDGDAPLAEDPTDTRPARARALRRAGLAPAAIADQLDVDALLVRAWVGEVPVAPAARSAPVARSGREVALAGTATRVPVRGGPAHRTAAVGMLDGSAERDRARLAARARLAVDAAFAAEVGLLAAIAELEPGGLTLQGERRELLARALTGLVDEAGVDRHTVRVVVRIGAEVAGDLARRRWAEALGVARERVVVTRWSGAPHRQAEDALVRIPSAQVATTVAGWCDALLDPADDPLDLAF